jgi:hypothetical protein
MPLLIIILYNDLPFSNRTCPNGALQMRQLTGCHHDVTLQSCIYCQVLA